jgi:hypothetical protein
LHTHQESLIEQKFIENKDSENRENLPKDYYYSAGVHPFKMKKDFCCIPTRESTGDRVFHNLQDGKKFRIFSMFDMNI